MNLSDLLVPDLAEITNTESQSFGPLEHSLMQSPRGTPLCHYRYDALDRLIANELPSMPQHQRFYCKSRLATEIQGRNRYSMIQHGDRLLAQQQYEGDILNATLLATDQQRSVLHTLKTNHPRQPIAYSPYGHRPIENGLLSLRGFNGERPDPVTGCYLLGNGYRAFNPVLMRFNSPDSKSPFDEGGLNSYAYCLGEPINRIDPTGHRTMFPMNHPIHIGIRQHERTAFPNPGPARNMPRPATSFPDKSPAWTTDPYAANVQAEFRRPSINSVETDTSFLSTRARGNIASPPTISGSEHPLPSYASATAPPPNYESLRFQHIAQSNSAPPPYSELTQESSNRPLSSHNIFRSLIRRIRQLGDNIRRGAHPIDRRHP